MKTRTLILIGILVLAVVVIAGSYATASDTELFLQSVKVYKRP